jgi:phosphate transport system protein
MATHLESSLQSDIDRIQNKVTDMGSLAERALEDGVQAVVGLNRKRAYGVILRDQYIDEMQKEIDRLCLEFLVRQQPVARNLRFVYSTIRINLELERVGDYAESIARQALKLSRLPVEIPKEWFIEIANHSLLMLRDALKAFVQSNVELAKATIAMEEKVDLLKGKLIKDLVNLYRENKLPFEALDPLTLTVRRLERVADQARNICQETLYACTGENNKYPSSDVFRVLFIDAHDSCATKMAELIAQSLNQSKFVFTSAGLNPQPISPTTAAFLQEKGHDTSRLIPRSLYSVPNLEYYHLIIALSPEVKKAFPKGPHRSIYLEWTVEDPSSSMESPEILKAAYERSYQALRASIDELAQAIISS